MIDDRTRAWLAELLDDADDHHRMNDWEDRFLEDMRVRLQREGALMTLSDKQLDALKRIEAKVHAI